MMNIFDYIICPVCGGALHRESKSLICENGHTFDIAKAGYVNLLPPGKEKNARTGDEKNMVKARVDFLAKNHYGKISDAAAAMIRKHCGDGFVSCADMGCGEGYHTCRIAERLETCVMLGFDASKYAAECASKLSKSKGMMPRDGVGAEHGSDASAYFFPANLFRLPVREHSLDAAVSMFAPIAGEESARILKEGGKLIVVSSGRDHLLEMRSLIYDEVHFSDPSVAVPEGFRKVDEENLKYTFTLTSREDIEALFVMTPFYYKTTEKGRERLLRSDSLTITAEVNLTVLEVQ